MLDKGTQEALPGVTVLLKGPRTLVVAPDGEAWLMRDGGPQLGVAGTGDVLAGVLGAVLGAESARASRGGTPEAGRPSAAALASDRVRLSPARPNASSMALAASCAGAFSRTTRLPSAARSRVLAFALGLARR